MKSRPAEMKPEGRQAPWLAVAMLYLSNAGCALMIGSHSDFTPLNTFAGKCVQPPVGPTAIKITTASPPEPHFEAGLIEVSAVGTGSDATSTALEHIREQASAHGCHAARLGGMSVKPGDDYGPPTNVPILDLLDLMLTDPKDRKLVNASCIVYTRDDCRDEPAGVAAATPAVPVRPATTSRTPAPAARPITNSDAAWAPR